jgi:hypothetical protein
LSEILEMADQVHVEDDEMQVTYLEELEEVDEEAETQGKK